MGKDQKAQTRTKTNTYGPKGKGTKPASKFVDVLNKVGTIAKAVGVVGTAIDAGLKVFKAFNDKEWYTKYYDVTPAANPNRPMDPPFNLAITDDATEGSVIRMSTINAHWDDYSDSYMFHQAATTMMQKLRASLRSNLPYNVAFVESYIINAIHLAISAKQCEKRVQWNLFSHPKFLNFNELWKRKGLTSGYGIAKLELVEWLDQSDAGTWAQSVASYDMMVSVYNATVKLPPRLERFISHYCGGVFVDRPDDYNDQVFDLMINSAPYASYDRSSGDYTTQQLSTDVSPQTILDRLSEFQQTYAVLIADLERAKQLVSSTISNFGKYAYVMLDDKSFKQAIINGYTDNQFVTPEGYIRLDEMKDLHDDLTQFIFLGALQPKGNTEDRSYTPAITIDCQVLKVDSMAALKWPAGFDQVQPNADGTVSFSEPFGIVVSSGISSDVYINGAIEQNQLQGGFGANQSDTLEIAPSGDTAVTLAVSDGYTSEEQLSGGGYTYKGTFDLLLPLLFVEGTNNSPRIYYAGAHFQLGESGTLWGSTKTYLAYADAIGWDMRGVALFRNNQPWTEPTAGSPFEIEGGTTSVSFRRCDSGEFIQSTIYVTNTDLLEQIGLRLSIPEYENAKETNLSRVFYYATITKVPDEVFTFTLDDYSLPAGKTTSAGASVKFSCVVSPTFGGTISGVKWVTPTATASSSVSATLGYTLLAPYAVQQVDMHIPIVSNTKLHINISAQGTPVSAELTAGKVLLKEPYIPYYYNIYDLVPTIYQMFTSLFSGE